MDACCVLGATGISITNMANSMDNELPAFTEIQTSPLILTEEKTQIETAVSPDVPYLHVAQRCNVGAVRQRNEDSSLVFSSETGGHFQMMPFGLYIVADGMGGHENGHMASRVASRMAARHVLSNIYLPLLQDEAAANQNPIQEVMEAAVLAAHKAIYAPDPATDSGTTLSVALVLSRRLYVAHVGDSRVYLLADGKFEAITTDHSLVQHLQDVGDLTPEEASSYQYRNVLLRAVGQTEDLEIDTYTRRLPQSGRLLLCSDGLCGLVPNPVIQKIMEQAVSIEKVADKLVATAMSAGGYDNITAIVVEFAF